MTISEVTRVRGIVERNGALLAAFTRALLADPALQAEIPKGATLVLIPDDAPELTEHNRALESRARAVRRCMSVMFTRASW